MAALDAPLWQAWIQIHRTDYTALFFDVALGTAPDPGPDEPENYRYAWMRLNRYRADVIARAPDGWHIIELRPRAGASAIGALLTYAEAWKLNPPDTLPLTLVLVTDSAKPEIASLARSARIRLDIVQPAF